MLKLSRLSNELIFSKEQDRVAESISKGYNVIVDAVAGSGKTTTIINIGKKCPRLRILTLLYNKNLSVESGVKIKNACPNIEVYTIHGFAQRCYKILCNNDNGLLKILDENTMASVDPYNLIIIDEAQDLTGITARVVYKLISDLSPEQVLLMGDHRQCIYGHMDADIRFLTEGDKIFNREDCKKLTLSTTYRCTDKMVDFINNCMLKDDSLKAHKVSKVAVEYIICDPFPSRKDGSYRLGEYFLEQVKNWIKNGYILNDIVILSPSLKGSSSPINHITNYLSKFGGYSIYKPDDDYKDLANAELMENKIICSTFHQFKGRERKIAIVVGFDNSIYEYYNNDSRDKPEICPNRLYVATTRATDILILLHSYTKVHLPFLDFNKVKKYANVKEFLPYKPKKMGSSKPKDFPVTGLIRHLPFMFVKSLQEYYTVTCVSEAQTPIAIKRIIQQEKTKEDVSAIYGTLIPFIKGLKNSHIIDTIKDWTSHPSDMINGVPMNIIREYVKLAKDLLIKKDFNYTALSYLSNFYNCISERYTHLLLQIHDYDWIETSTDKIDEAIAKLNFLSSETEYEVPIIYSNTKCTINGAIDAIDGNVLWEFKCVGKITDEHILQLVVYTCLDLLKVKTDITSYKIFNILNSESYEVKVSDPKILLELLINKKLSLAEESIPMEELIGFIQS